MTIEQWLDTELGTQIWKNKYCYNNETFDDWLNRVSGFDDKIKKLIKEKKFLFGGRTLSNRGLNNGSYSNCYTSGRVKDDLTEIMKVNSNLALTYKAQGGQGLSLSDIRPKGTLIGGRYESDGIVPFMEIYNTTTESVMNGGSRKGALMMSLDITHKEAETFITIKSDLNKITKANLSVEIDDEFMEVVEESYKTNSEIPLNIIKTYGKEIVEYTIIPIKLYKLLIKQAHSTAEPGVIFTNPFKNYNLMEFCDDYIIEGANPCGEQPLAKDSACNLGSINLSQYVLNPFSENSIFDYDSFNEDVKICIEALDLIIDENADNHALKEQKEMSLNYRNIGLGIMGLADTFIKLGIKYGSKESLSFVESITSNMLKSAVLSSINLADKKGTFPKYNPELFNATILKNIFSKEELEEFKNKGIRNCSLLSIAPTGTLGTMLNISTGIEPIFAFSFNRTTKSLHNSGDVTYKVNVGVVDEYIKFTNNSELPEYFVSSYDINWKDRINLQSVTQKYIDTAISSTINLKQDVNLLEIEDLYLYA
jgi:ribonucleoside-diphosphate reductase alpha chain